MLQERPFRSAEHLLTAAEEAWRHATAEDWQEAFDHHPRIGEQGPRSAVSAEATSWSADEQARAAPANPDVRQELVRANAAYERRFGRIYIVCAAGLEADEILADLQRRLANDPEVEQRIAAAEQARITALRLRKLIGHTL
jgi:2-oxo-4-hydroxy-4-carboxy-5-ureidoimidazoline decarboxylase